MKMAAVIFCCLRWPCGSTAVPDAVLLGYLTCESAQTDAFRALEALHRELSPKGFAVLGFPSNDFGGQEPGTNKQIKEFCESKYDVDFPMAAKVSVQGSDAHPFYKCALDGKQINFGTSHKRSILMQIWLTAIWGCQTA